MRSYELPNICFPQYISGSLLYSLTDEEIEKSILLLNQSEPYKGAHDEVVAHQKWMKSTNPQEFKARLRALRQHEIVKEKERLHNTISTLEEELKNLAKELKQLNC